MKIVLFEINQYEKDLFDGFLKEINTPVDIVYSEEKFNVDLAKDAEIVSIFVNSEIREKDIDSLSNLRLIATRSTGYDHIDYSYAKSKGVEVASVPSYGSHTVAEFTFALILSLSRKIYPAYNQLREGSNFDISGLKGFELFGKTLGVIGMGRIGKNVIKIARGFDMNILAYDINPDLKFAEETCTKCVSLEDVLTGSDIITIHTFLSESTRHIINKDNINKIKKGAYIINTSRGEMIETEALLQSITSGHLAGAGLDVLESERQLREEIEIFKDKESKIKDFKTLYENHVLIDLPQVIVTPHIAFDTKEAEEEIVRVTLSNIKNFLNNTPKNLV